MFRDDMRRAIERYAQASERVVIEVVREGGRPLAPLEEWLSCWAPVFAAVPGPALQAGCYTKQGVMGVISQIETMRRSVRDALGDWAWLIDPVGKATDELMAEAEREVVPLLKEATASLTGIVAGSEMEQMARLMLMKSSAQSLNALFRTDESGKSLLRIPDIAQRVQFDMGLRRDEPFDIERFPPVHNAVVLAKLALLDGAELNRLTQEFGVRGPTRYGATLYPKHAAVNVLLGAIASIDGDHQWLVQAPPYLRARGALKFPDSQAYSYAFPDGFRLFQDPTARERIFHQIFRGPLAPGIESPPAKMKRLLPADYPYHPSVQDPFPDYAR